MKSTKAILFDLDGVFYEADKPIPGAAAISKWVVAQNIPHLFLTNTTSRPRSALLEKLHKFGIETTIDHILTPPAATIRWIQSQAIKGGVALYLPEATQVEFSTLKLSQSTTNEKVSAIVIGDLGEQWNYQILNSAFRLLMQKPAPKLISLGLTRYWKAEDGLRLDVAPFVAALECASGIKPIVMGKPAKVFYEMALKILKVRANETLMIGDDIRGDIEGAQKAGIKAALVKTGKFRASDLTMGINPDVILNSVNDLPKLWETL